MAILRAEKIIVAGLGKVKDEFLKRIQKEALIHFESLKEFQPQAELKIKKLEEVEEAIRFLSSYESKKVFGTSLEPIKLDREALESGKDFNQEFRIVKEILSLKEEVSKIEEEKKQKRKALQEIKKWEFLDVSLKELDCLKSFSLILLSEEPAIISGIIEKSPLKNKPYFLHAQSLGKRSFSFFIIAKEDFREFSSYFREAKLNLISLPPLLTEYKNQTPKKIEETLLRNIEVLNKEKEKKIKKIKSFLPYKGSLIFLYEYFFNSFLREEKKSSFLETEKVFLAEGWVLSKDKEKLSVILERFKNIFFVIREPSKGELFPVKLQNKKLIRPFELIVNMYGAPHPLSLDPTFLLAPFLFMFVGICISDAGYGLVLALFSLLLLKKIKPLGLLRTLLQLIFYLGLSTFLVGFLLGGVFGVSFKVFQVLDPLKDTFKFLLFCFFLGFIQVLVGMLAKVYLEIKRKNYRALFVQLCWILLLIDLPLYFIKYKIAPLKYLGIASGLGILLFAQPHKNIFVRVVKGLYELYGISKYFSDVLSYSRLVALGLATGVIAMVVNILAGVAFKIPILGVFLGLGVLVLGHSFNIFINLLSGLIHSARLQFVEFFSKFFELGGRFFEPFSFKTKYAHLKE